MNEITEFSDDEFGPGFSAALGRLQVAVLEACRREEVWPAKVAAGVRAAVEFAIDEPRAARLLTIQALIKRPDGGRRYMRMLEYFAELLSTDAPRDRRRPLSTQQALVGGVATVVADHLRAATFDDLRAEIPGLVELVLVPYIGRGEAREWGRRAGS